MRLQVAPTTAASSPPSTPSHALQNRSGRTIGLTLRVGRHVENYADMIKDLLFNKKDQVSLTRKDGTHFTP